mmetsp:Transcript_9427/g.12557  ORF Transcript_9427/g.12557 Transcript_9427/m.12557 type:complete len:101 (-) Transcript_9427:132-434(-)
MSAVRRVACQGTASDVGGTGTRRATPLASCAKRHHVAVCSASRGLICVDVLCLAVHVFAHFHQCSRDTSYLPLLTACETTDTNASASLQSLAPASHLAVA